MKANSNDLSSPGLFVEHFVDLIRFVLSPVEPVSGLVLRRQPSSSIGSDEVPEEFHELKY